VFNSGFSEFLEAAPRDRRDVFLGAATRLGTPEQNVEKTSGLRGHSMCCSMVSRWPSSFSFQGRNFLSKAYGLISRFSEDIDITVFWRTSDKRPLFQNSNP
jgi:hypothetical protein